jgi:hypothetical protein
VKYDPNAHTLQARYAFTGLAPNHAHPIHAHGGHCASPALYDLRTVTADGAGNSSGAASARSVTTDQPSSGWYIALHSGAGGSAFDQLVLTCAAITGLVGVSGQPASGTVEFLEGVGPNMTATSYAQFVDQGGGLTATVTAEGLEPGSTRPLFVRKGTREQRRLAHFKFVSRQQRRLGAERDADHRGRGRAQRIVVCDCLPRDQPRRRGCQFRSLPAASACSSRRYR